MSGSEQGQQLDDQFNRFGMMMDLMSAMLADARSGDAAHAAVRQTLTPDMMDALGLRDWSLLNLGGELDINNGMDMDMLFEHLSSQAEQLRGDIAAAMQDGENPVAQALNAWAATGFDESNLDPTMLSGSLAGFVRLLLLQEGGIDTLGSEAMEAIGSGLSAAAPDTVKEATSAAGKVSAALGGISGGYQAGYDAVDDIRKGIVAAQAGAVAAAAAAVGAIASQLNLVTPGTGLFDGSGSSGGGVSGSGGTNVDSSVNVTIQNANMTSPADANVLGNRIAAASRNSMAAVGVIQ